MTELQERTAKAMVNVFETGHPQGGYGTVTLLRGDRGGLSYGRSQATLASGALHRLLAAYCGVAGARQCEPLRATCPAWPRATPR